MAVTEFEGATKVTKGDGTRHLVKRSFCNVCFLDTIFVSVTNFGNFLQSKCFDRDKV